MTDAQQNYRHVARVIAMVLSAVGAPDCIEPYITALFVTLGFDVPDWTECHDAQLAWTTSIGSRESDDVTTTRAIGRIRRARAKLHGAGDKPGWQDMEGNPPLVEFKLVRRDQRDHPHYKLPIGYLIAMILRECPAGTSDKLLRNAVKRHVREYCDEWEGEARRKRSERHRSPEASNAQGSTLLNKAYLAGLAKGKSEDLAIEEVVDALAAKFQPEIMDRICAEWIRRRQIDNFNDAKQLANQPEKLKIEPNPNSVNELPEILGYKTRDPEIYHDHEENYVSNSEPAPTPAPIKPLLGMSPSEFLEQLAIEEGARQIANGSGRKIDRTSPLRRHTRRHPCPICGGDGCATPESGDLTICRRQSAGADHEAENGVGWVHYAGADPIPYVAPPKPRRTTPAPIELYRAAEPVASTAGAKYLAGRGVPADTATAAGVRYHNHRAIGRSVVFPIRSRDREVIALQSRAITGRARYNDGLTGGGIFSAPSNALDSDRLAICEAPIDALVLAAAGLPAIATCGAKNWPEWSTEVLAGKQLFLASDADNDGDVAAARQAERLQGWAVTIRLRPNGPKDWGEIAEQHGLDAVRAQINGALNEKYEPDG